MCAPPLQSLDPKQLMEWCAETFSAVGLVRQLTLDDLQVRAAHLPARPHALTLLSAG